MWQAYSLAKQLKTRPSEVYAIEDEVVAWSFDRAVQIFGTNLDAAITEATDKTKTKKAAQAKAQQVLDRWLDSGDTKAPSTRRFRDPAAGMKSRKV